jgi:extracellular factor (EF) 3-hydroxypalmitic acid methyl ester biosynthesis protein
MDGGAVETKNQLAQSPSARENGEPERNPVSDVRSLSEKEATSGERVANYADFEGGQGRDVYFRPDRYLRSDLGPIGVIVEVRAGDKRHPCELVDVSQNGVAFDWPAHVSVEVGTIFDEIIVKFDELEAYRGEARVGSVRRENGKIIVGASFVDTLMNIEDVLHLRDVKAWNGGAGAKGLGLSESPWRVPGQERFKSLVAELRLFLEDARAKFDELEASLPWHVAHGEHDSPAQAALIERVRSEFAADVVQCSVDIDTALRVATRAEREPLREFSVRHLHEILMLSPLMHRARYKPLGYPGDYETMNAIYGRHFDGPTLFAKALNLAFASTSAATAVRTRKDLVKQRLGAILDAPPPRDRPLRILSVAAGPAQEVFELLQEREHIAHPVEIVLFDQDKRALAFSYGRLKRVVSAKWQGQVTLIHLHDAIRRLLRGSSVFAGYGDFDAVFSCGLFDYLELLTSVTLCRSLYALVARGGTLYVGNMVPSCSSRWLMEMHLDWFLVYRERSQMLELARMAAPDARIEILEEGTGVNPFVAVTRE